MKRKGNDLFTKPPGNYVPAVNLQGCKSPCHLPTPLPSVFFVVWQLQEYQGASGTAAYVVSSPGFVDPLARCPALYHPEWSSDFRVWASDQWEPSPPKKKRILVQHLNKFRIRISYLRLFLLFEENSFLSAQICIPQTQKKKTSEILGRKIIIISPTSASRLNDSVQEKDIQWARFKAPTSCTVTRPGERYVSRSCDPAGPRKVRDVFFCEIKWLYYTKSRFGRWCSFSIGWFLCSMLIFQGVAEDVEASCDVLWFQNPLKSMPSINL